MHPGGAVRGLGGGESGTSAARVCRNRASRYNGMMTSAGVEGTAGSYYLEARLTPAARPSMFIKHDDEWLGQRYIEPKYPWAPAGATPMHPARAASGLCPA